MARYGVAYREQEAATRQDGSLFQALLGFSVGAILLTSGALLLGYETLRFLESREWESFSLLRIGTIPMVRDLLPSDLPDWLRQPQNIQAFRSAPGLLAVIDAIPAWVVFGIAGLISFRSAAH
ncbi:MAG TPA: hypothetical protein VNN07_02690 [Candidatus Tectomicrobia bacterium]|nr:hypothetical protein [Candidatus Tectomicrobia bacterium]